jgi:hypothetical protein
MAFQLSTVIRRPHTHKGESKVAIIWRESIEQADELVSVKILSTIEKKRKKRWTCIQCKSIAESIAFFQMTVETPPHSRERDRATKTVYKAIVKTISIENLSKVFLLYFVLYHIIEARECLLQ